MRKQNNQSGSAHLIIIIVLVVALLGALGTVFLYNFEKSKKANDTSAADTSNGLNTATMSDLYKLQFKYPITWKAQHTKSNLPKTSDVSSLDQYVLLSPDKKYTLNIELIARGQFGGACDSGHTSSLFAYTTSAIAGWSDKSFAGYYYKDLDSNKWYAYAAVGQTAKLQNISSASNYCDISFLGLTQLTNNSGSDNVHFRVDVLNNTSDYSAPHFDTQAEAQAFVDSQNFKDIKAMLLSIVAS